MDEELPGSQSMRDALKDGWLKIENAKDNRVVKAMQRDLDKGEAEAIALAIQENAEWVLMDEREGRKAARSMQLKTVGVLGILLKARRNGTLNSLENSMNSLKKKAGFYIQTDLYNALLKEAGEK